MRAMKELGGLSMKTVWFLCFSLFFVGNVCVAAVDVLPDPTYSGVRESDEGAPTGKRRSLFGKIKKLGGRGVGKLKSAFRRKGEEDLSAPAPDGPPPQDISDRRALRGRVERSRKGAFGRLKTKLGLSTAGRVCRPRKYRDMDDAAEHLQEVQGACKGGEYNKVRESFCVKYCNTDAQCFPRCPYYCQPWLKTAAIGAQSRKRLVLVAGVRACVAKNVVDPPSSEDDFDETYSSFKSRLSKKAQKTFISGEKDCKKAGKDYARGLLKACVILRRVEEIVRQYEQLSGVPLHILNSLREAFKDVNKDVSKALDKAEIPAGKILSFEEIVRGFFDRVHHEARRHVEAQWSATHEAWTYDKLRKACMDMREAVESAYNEDTLGDYEEGDQDGHDYENLSSLYEDAQSVQEEASMEQKAEDGMMQPTADRSSEPEMKGKMPEEARHADSATEKGMQEASMEKSAEEGTMKRPTTGSNDRDMKESVYENVHHREAKN